MWEEWFQSVGGDVIRSAADAKFRQPFELQRLQLQALGADGKYYPEGRPAPARQGGGFVLDSTTLLLIGGAVVLLMVLRD